MTRIPKDLFYMDRDFEKYLAERDHDSGDREYFLMGTADLTFRRLLQGKSKKEVREHKRQILELFMSISAEVSK